MEETEDTLDPEDDNKPITVVESHDLAKGQPSLLSGDGTEKVVSVQSEEIDPSDDFAIALKLAWVVGA